MNTLFNIKIQLSRIAIIFVASLLSFSCSKQEDPILSISVTELNLGSDNQSVTFAINSNTDWTLFSNVDWLTVLPITGNGNSIVTVTVAANTTHSQRTARVSVVGAGQTSVIEVTQKQLNALILTSKNIILNNNETTIDVELKSNIEYDIILPEGVSWLSHLGTKSLNTYIHQFSVSANTGFENRSTQVIFKDKRSLLADTLTINQLQLNAIILTSKRENIGSAGGSINVEINTNIAYDIVMPQGISWIALDQTKGLSTYNHSILVLANDTYSDREAVVIFKDKSSSLADTLTISQHQMDAIILNSRSRTIVSEGGIIEIELNTNIEYDMILPSGVSWVSLSGTKSLVSYTHQFYVSANPDYSSREAHIIFRDKHSSLSDTLTIIQMQKDGLFVTPKSTSVPSSGSTVVATVSSNIEYNVIIPSGVGWVSKITTKGLTENDHTFEVSSNSSYDPRTVKIIFKAKTGELSDTLIINQAAKDGILLTAKTKTVVSGGGIIDVEINTNVEYDIILPSGVSWVSLSGTKSLVSYTHQFYVSANPDYSSREAHIIFRDKHSSLSDTLTIIQMQKDGLFVTPKSAEIPNTGGTVNAQVMANVDYQIIMPQGVTWVSNVTSKALLPGNYTFSVSQNELNQARSANVIFKATITSLADTIRINQLPSNYFSLSTYEFRVQKNGGNYSYSVTANIPYSVRIVNGGTWLSQSSPGSLETRTYNLEISNNTSGSERIALIIFDYAAGADTLTVRQYSFDGYFADIKESETLASTIPQGDRSSIERLKISGLLTAADFSLLRSDFRGVRFYDLSEASLVSNGIPSGAFRIVGSPAISLEQIILPPGLLNIGENAFNGCINLTDIILPPGITSIGAGAFNGCTSLADIIIPSGVTSIGAGAFAGSSSLAKVTTRIQNPFAISNVFTGIYTYADLLVPAGKVATYENTTGWGYDFFSRIYVEGTTPPVDNISLTSGSIRSSGAGQTLTVTVEATGSWQVESKPSWITVTPSSGSGNQTVSIAFAPYSSTPVTRTGNVVFKLSGKMPSANLEVNQHNFPYNDGDYVKVQSSTIGNGIDLVFMGDGYTIEDIGAGQYISNISDAIGYFFDIEPYTTYRNYFDVYIVYAFSQESGIGDHLTTKNTRFGTRYTSPAPSTSMTTNAATCFTYAAKPPLSSTLGETTVVLIANSMRYGGTAQLYSNGQAIAICPMSTYAYPYDFRGLVQHEAAGHGFGKLADEYVNNQTTIPDAQKATLVQWQGYNHFLNVDLTNNLSAILWKHFIGEPNYSYVGAYEGAYYYQSGVWRPESGSLMINNINYINAPGREMIVKRIKQLAGMPYSFTDFKLNDVYQAGAVRQAVGLPIDPDKILPPPVLIDVGK